MEETRQTQKDLSQVAIEEAENGAEAAEAALNGDAHYFTYFPEREVVRFVKI